jgi:hypothetical protein
MPNPTLSDAMKEAYASADVSDVIINTIEIRHPAFSEPIRVVSDYVPIDALLEVDAPANGGEIVTFQAFAFEFTLPEVMDRGVPELQLRIDNVSREIIRNIELAVPEQDKLELTYRAYLQSDLTTNGPHNDPPLHLTITSIDADAMVVNARATIADFVNKKFPNEEYDETKFPGLIAS